MKENACIEQGEEKRDDIEGGKNWGRRRTEGGREKEKGRRR